MGGADVDPQLYNQEREDILPDPKEEGRSAIKWLRYLLALIFYPVLFVIRKASSRKGQISSDRLRDKLELNLVEAAVKEEMPVLGICRGAQLLNIHFGGSLYQNINMCWGCNGTRNIYRTSPSSARFSNLSLNWRAY